MPTYFGPTGADPLNAAWMGCATGAGGEGFTVHYQVLDQNGTFRNATIQSMRAVGSKGLRINQGEIQMAIDNDVPKMTDTLPVAQQKLKNLQTFLNNAENAHSQLNR